MARGSKASSTVQELSEIKNHTPVFIGEKEQEPVRLTVQKDSHMTLSDVQKRLNGLTYATEGIHLYTLKGRVGKDTEDNPSASLMITSQETSSIQLCQKCWTAVLQALTKSLDPTILSRLSSSLPAMLTQQRGSQKELSILFGRLMTLLDLNGKTAASDATAKVPRSRTPPNLSMKTSTLTNEMKKSQTYLEQKDIHLKMHSSLKELKTMKMLTDIVEGMRAALETEQNPMMMQIMELKIIELEKEMTQLAEKIKRLVAPESKVPERDTLGEEEEDNEFVKMSETGDEM